MVHYFASGIKERRRIGYRFRPPCVKRMRYRSYCERFFGVTNYRMANVVIEYYKKILIISMSIRLHGIWYFDLSSYNIICLTYRDERIHKQLVVIRNTCSNSLIMKLLRYINCNKLLMVNR